MAQEIQVNHLVINKLTKEQFNGITPNENEIYFVTGDAGVSADEIFGSTAIGDVTHPIYWNGTTLATATTYSGGTVITLNNMNQAGASASFYAPTEGGTANYYLKSNGATSAPTWEAVPVASTTAAGIVQLSSATNSTATDMAATPSAVKAAYDLAASGSDIKQNVTLATTSKAFITGVTTTPTAAAQALEGIADTGVYLTAAAGEISAVKYSLNVDSTEKAYMSYNTATNAIDFVFV